MSLKVVGAGLGRTGTYSLKLALEQLLGGTCYHMYEVGENPDHVPIWHAAAKGESVDWKGLMNGYTAAVDWPASAYWQELSEHYPDAVILLSVRNPDSWWKSASTTIFPAVRSRKDTDRHEWHEMVMTMMASRFTHELDDKNACIQAFERHNAHVHKTAPANRLVVWQASDGWEPICKALNMPIPDAPFPKANTSEEFIAARAAEAAKRAAASE